MNTPENATDLAEAVQPTDVALILRNGALLYRGACQREPESARVWQHLAAQLDALATVIESSDAPLPEREVAITLTGAEWVAFMARAMRRELSTEGARTYKRAATKLAEQIKAAAAVQP